MTNNSKNSNLKGHINLTWFCSRGGIKIIWTLFQWQRRWQKSCNAHSQQTHRNNSWAGVESTQMCATKAQLTQEQHPAFCSLPTKVQACLDPESLKAFYTHHQASCANSSPKRMPKHTPDQELHKTTEQLKWEGTHKDTKSNTLLLTGQGQY